MQITEEALNEKLYNCINSINHTVRRFLMNPGNNTSVIWSRPAVESTTVFSPSSATSFSDLPNDNPISSKRLATPPERENFVSRLDKDQDFY